MSSSPQRSNVQSGQKLSTPRKPGRLCKKCGTKHTPPTGKNCRAARAQQLEKRGSQSTQNADQQVSPGGPIESRVIHNGSPVVSPSVGPTRTMQQSMGLLANTVASMATAMKTMQQELADLQNEKVNSSWQHMQDLSVQGDVGNNINFCNVPISRSSQNRRDVEGPVTVTHLRASDEIQGRAAAQQARFQKQTEEYLTQGELFSKTEKSGRNVWGVQSIN